VPATSENLQSGCRTSATFCTRTSSIRRHSQNIQTTMNRPLYITSNGYLDDAEFRTVFKALESTAAPTTRPTNDVEDSLPYRPCMTPTTASPADKKFGVPFSMFQVDPETIRQVSLKGSALGPQSKPTSLPRRKVSHHLDWRDTHRGLTLKSFEIETGW
jgi:hypothetical protein